MKRILFIIATVLFIPIVANAETITKSTTSKYLFEDLNVTCSDSILDLYVAYYLGMDSDYNHYYVDGSEYFLYNVNGCRKMTIDEIYQMNNSYELITYELNSNYEIIAKRRLINSVQALYGTNDMDVDATKTYYYLDGSSYKEVTNPSNNDIANYYEYVWFKGLTSSTVPTNAYTISTIGSETVSSHARDAQTNIDTDENKAAMYYAIATEAKVNITETVLTINNEKLKNIIDSNLAIIAVNYSPKTNIGVITFEENNKYVSYDTNGNKYDNVMLADVFTNNLVMGENKDGHLLILDDNGTVIHTDNTMYDMNEYSYDKDNYYTIGVYSYYDSSYGKNVPKFYGIQEFSLLSEDNKKIDSKTNYTIKLTGDSSTLEKVKLGSTELVIDKDYILDGNNVVLSKDYLRTLTPGKYTLNMEYWYSIIIPVNFELTSETTTVTLTPDANGNTQVLPTNNFLDNPQTFDGIGNATVMLIISSFGLIGTTIYLKRKNILRNY